MREENQNGQKQKKEALYGERFGGLAFFSFIAVYCVVSFVGQAVLQSFSPSETVSVAISALFSVLSMYIVIKTISLQRKEKITLTAYAKKFDFAYIFPSIILAFGMLFGLGFINYVVSDLVVALGGKIHSRDIPLNSVGQLLLFVFLLGVLPAVEEECFFRGLLLSNLKNGKKASGIFIVALCFAFYHGNVSQLVYQFIYGIFLAILTIRAKSVVAGMIAHFTNNAFVLIAQYYNLQINLTDIKTIIVGLVLLSMFFTFIFFYKRNEKDEFTEQTRHDEKAERFFIPYGIAGLAVCTVMIVAGVLV